MRSQVTYISQDGFKASLHTSQGQNHEGLMKLLMSALIYSKWLSFRKIKPISPTICSYPFNYKRIHAAVDLKVHDATKK